MTEALVRLLKGALFSRCKSIIVYCTRREQTARVATLIRTQMKDFYGDDSDESDYEGDATPPRNKKREQSLHTYITVKSSVTLQCLTAETVTS